MSAFFYHYNKPASRKAGHPVLTVHCQGICHLVRHIECHVPTKTRERKTQPHVVVAGKGTVAISGETAYITNERCRHIHQPV